MNTKTAPTARGGSPGAHTWHLALLSGESAQDVESGAASWCEQGPGPVPGIAHRYRLNGSGGPYRSAVVARPAGADGRWATEGAGAPPSPSANGPGPVAFMFPGLGDHHIDMGKGLYCGFPEFAGWVDHCARILEPELSVDVRELIFTGEPEPGTHDDSPSGDLDLRQLLGRQEPKEASRLDRSCHAQPALFVIEYALAKLWEAWGVQPDAMIGYSLGEYVAATLAGVMGLEDALRLVARRARLIEEAPEGAMLAVGCSAERLSGLLDGQLSLSAVNGPEFCVVAGPPGRVGDLRQRLAGEGVAVRPVRSRHAFHSAMMEPLREEVTGLTEGVALSPPRIPYISNVTGRPITDDEATDPAYWARHLCSPVRFGDGLHELGMDHILLEMGPGQSLSSIAAEHRGGDTSGVIASMRHPLEKRADAPVFLRALGALWTRGGTDAHAVDASDIAVGETPGTADPGEHEPSGTEERLLRIWRKLLSADSVSVHTSFFDLGGNSLAASRMLLRIEREFGAGIALTDVYENPTVARLAEVIEATLGEEGEPDPSAGDRDRAREAYRATAQPPYRLPNGLVVHHQNESETKHFYEDIFDHRTYARNGICIGDGATVFDVGGNIGLFSLFAHYEAEDVKVITFEPSVELFGLLERNLKAHGVDAELLNIGVSDREETADLTFYPRSSGMSSFMPDEEEEKANLRAIIGNQSRIGDGGEAEELRRHEDELMDVRFQAVTYPVDLRPLSAVIRERGIERVDLVKIDVQKSEEKVINGIADEDWPRFRQFVMEVHDGGGRVERLTRILRSRGFSVTVEQDPMYERTDIHNLYAIREK